MKSSKEFFERLANDEAFAKEIAEKAKAIADGGEQDYKKIFIPLAAEYGYEVTGEELDELHEKASELSEEELGKVAGGTTVWCGVLVVTIFASAIYNGENSEYSSY